MATIHHLPVEILSIIFALLNPEFTEEREVTVAIPQQEIITDDSPTETLKFVYNGRSESDFPQIFPYCVAGVCTHWLEILKIVPEYWTFAIFDVTVDPAPFLDVFKWSSGYLISVHIFNPEASSLDEEHLERPPQGNLTLQRKSAEQACVARITDALVPHLWRCLGFNYRLLYSSSLPPLPRLLQNHNNDLNQLEYRGLGYRGLINEPSFDWTRHRSISVSMVMRNLINLTLDVAAFIALSQNQSDGWESFECSKECQITLDQYTFPGASGGSQEFHNTKRYTLQQFIYALDTLSEVVDILRLRSLSIESPSSTSASQDLVTVASEQIWGGCKNLLLVDNSSSFLAIFLPLILKRQFDSVSFISCDLPYLDPGLPRELRATSIYFDDLSIHARLENILGGWDGSYLNIDNCPSFGPAVLQFLAEERPSNAWSCPSMTGLTISNCEIEDYGYFDNFIAMRRGTFHTTAIRELAILGKTMLIFEEEYNRIRTEELLDDFKYEGCIILD